MRNILEEVQIEIIKNSLHKLYLEDFYRVCQVRWPLPSKFDEWIDCGQGSTSAFSLYPWRLHFSSFIREAKL